MKNYQITLIVASLITLLCAPISYAKKQEKAKAKVTVQKTSKVKSIIFIGKKHACNCTKNRVAQTWDNLSQTLKVYAPINIKRINMDVEKKETQRLRKMAPFFVAPAIYFFDQKGKLLKRLQGKVTKNIFQKVL